jgi:hypothetical protein
LKEEKPLDCGDSQYPSPGDIDIVVTSIDDSNHVEIAHVLDTCIDAALELNFFLDIQYQPNNPTSILPYTSGSRFQFETTDETYTQTCEITNSVVPKSKRWGILLDSVTGYKSEPITLKNHTRYLRILTTEIYVTDAYLKAQKMHYDKMRSFDKELIPNLYLTNHLHPSTRWFSLQLNPKGQNAYEAPINIKKL